MANPFDLARMVEGFERAETRSPACFASSVISFI
jgi:hypothetical protein